MMRNKSRQRGVAAIEFALIAPVVLVILYGVFEFGFAFWRKQGLTAAVREGARRAIVLTNPRVTEADVVAEVMDYMANVGLDHPDAAASCPTCPCPIGANSGQSVTVNAFYPTQFLVLSGLQYGGGMASSVGLSASVVMQCE